MCAATVISTFVIFLLFYVPIRGGESKISER